MCDYKDELDSYVDYVKSIMPAEIRAAIATANCDLYSGPVYFNGEGEESSCFDDGAVQFDFSGACKRISDWFDSNVDDLQTEVAFDDETGESIYERVDGSSGEVIKAIIGRELFAHVH